MSEEIELTTPPTPAVTAAGPRLDDLSAAALAQLVLGFYFLFWGLLLLVAVLTESFVITALRPLSILLFSAGGLAMANGAWRLHRITGLGESWRNRTRELLVITALVAYLSLFFLMWRRLPTQIYLLAHALTFFALVIAALCWLCLPVMVLARAADRPGLAMQTGAFGTVALVLLAPPFGLVAMKLIEATREGSDPFSLLQYWVEHTALWMTMIFLIPVSLTLSLLWSAKDLLLDRLTSRSEN